jgi:manganese transport protein
MLTQLQVGGMYGGVAQVMHALIPAVPIWVWVMLTFGLTLSLLLGGGYERIERFSVFKVALFTVLTICAALVLLASPQYFSVPDMLAGLKPTLPAAGLATAIAVFGITGVGATELIMYPYWCVEKGYARFAGRRDASAEWTQRARGWIAVMHLDIVCSLVVYTMATVAFYLLGAGVLHGQGLVPAAGDTIRILSQIYTDTLGEWARWPFYVGAIATLYGTIFAATAAHARSFADMCRVMGLYRRDDYGMRLRYRRGFVIAFVILPVALYLLIESPVSMVIFGGVAQALMLPLIGVATIYLHHRHLPSAVTPAVAVTVALWACTALCTAAMAYYAALTIGR